MKTSRTLLTLFVVSRAAKTTRSTGALQVFVLHVVLVLSAPTVVGAFAFAFAFAFVGGVCGGTGTGTVVADAVLANTQTITRELSGLVCVDGDGGEGAGVG